MRRRSPADAPGQWVSRPGPVALPGTDEWGTPPAPRRDSWPRREGAGRRRAPSAGSMMAGQVRGRVRQLGHDAAKPANRSRVIVGGGAGPDAAAGRRGGAVRARSRLGRQAADDADRQRGAGRHPADRDAAVHGQTRHDDQVPKGWTKSATGTYVDFVDPAGAAAGSGSSWRTPASTAQKFFENAGVGLRRPSICPQPYQRLGLTDATLAGKAGGGARVHLRQGRSMRHGIWRGGGQGRQGVLVLPDRAGRPVRGEQADLRRDGRGRSSSP